MSDYQCVPMRGPLKIMKKVMRMNSETFLPSSVQSLQWHNPAEFIDCLQRLDAVNTAVVIIFVLNDERSGTVDHFPGCQLSF